MGLIILALILTVIRLAKRIIRMSDRVNAVDDYLFNKFLMNKIDEHKRKTKSRSNGE